MRSRKTDYIKAICIDNAKNFSYPNITFNNVYYKRQLSFYVFNAHVLSDGKSVFFIPMLRPFPTWVAMK